MNDIDISNLDEDLCKTVLNTLVKQAYGYHAKISIRRKNYMRNGCDLPYYIVMLNMENVEYGMLGYRDSEVKTTFGVYLAEFFSFKKLLFEMMDFVKTPNSCISYLPDKPSFIDNSTSLEEVLVNLDLADVE